MTWMMFLLVGCGATEAPAEPETVSAAPASDPITVAATIANAIAASPASADEVLKKYGMTEEAYRALLFEIAEDETKSRAFMAARH